MAAVPLTLTTSCSPRFLWRKPALAKLDRSAPGRPRLRRFIGRPLADSAFTSGQRLQMGSRLPSGRGLANLVGHSTTARLPSMEEWLAASIGL
jgi:hypothetical protein